MKVTIEPTAYFYPTGRTMLRAWTGITGDGTEIVAFVAGALTPKSHLGDLTAEPPPTAASLAVRIGVWALCGKLSEAEGQELLAYATSRAAFRDDSCVERLCDHCGTPYRGPSVYCCHACATADA